MLQFHHRMSTSHYHFFWYTPTKAVYIISNKGPLHLRWQLALMNATTALECMRHKDVNMGELLSFLVQSGRAFMMHCCHSQIPLPVYCYPFPIIQSSFWSLSRLPTVHDHYTYHEGTWLNFLSQPWGCTALMQGSIIWCLAVGCFGDQAEDVVTNGPSDNALRFGKLMYYSGNQFWDNGLTENEMDLQ